MKSLQNMTLVNKTKWKIRILWGILIAMIIYMVLIGELGLGDSRMMTRLAATTSRAIFFGSMIWVAYRIWYHKKLLKDHTLLVGQHIEHQDERRQYLHDKSGGLVFDILLVSLLFITCTAALVNMPAFYVSFGVLLLAVALKIVFYAIYQSCS